MKLTPEQEKEFLKWKLIHAPNDSGEDYDLRAAFLSGFKPDEKGHWPDTYKLPNHPTFSNETKYAPDAPHAAGSWDGDKYVPPPSLPTPQAPFDILKWMLNVMKNSRRS